ncbi:MAG: hypothetical protein HKN43_01520 [Rhodothermales bacterium]|nr:hypothetical protein [Rhodothermales bacterium]
MIDRHAPQPKSVPELRKFGVVMTGAFSVVAAIMWWKGVDYFSLVVAVAGLFLLLAVGFPSVLRPVEFVWMKIAVAIGAVMTRVILTIVFVFVVTPIGLLMRLSGKDPLRIKEIKTLSYWIDADREGTAARPDKPF